MLGYFKWQFYMHAWKTWSSKRWVRKPCSQSKPKLVALLNKRMNAQSPQLVNVVFNGLGVSNGKQTYMFTHNTKLKKIEHSKSSWQTREISYTNGMQFNMGKCQFLNPYGKSQLHKHRMEKQVITRLLCMEESKDYDGSQNEHKLGDVMPLWNRQTLYSIYE